MSSTRTNSSQPFPNHTAQELFHYLMNKKNERENMLRLLQDIEKRLGAENLLRNTLELAKAARIDAKYPRSDDGVPMAVTHPTAEEQQIEWMITTLRIAIKFTRVERKGYADDSFSSPELSKKTTRATKHDYQSFLMWRQKKTLHDEQVLAELVRDGVGLG